MKEGALEVPVELCADPPNRTLSCHVPGRSQRRRPWFRTRAWSRLLLLRRARARLGAARPSATKGSRRGSMDARRGTASALCFPHRQPSSFATVGTCKTRPWRLVWPRAPGPRPAEETRPFQLLGPNFQVLAFGLLAMFPRERGRSGNSKRGPHGPASPLEALDRMAGGGGPPELAARDRPTPPPPSSETDTSVADPLPPAPPRHSRPGAVSARKPPAQDGRAGPRRARPRRGRVGTIGASDAGGGPMRGAPSVLYTAERALSILAGAQGPPKQRGPFGQRAFRAEAHSGREPWHRGSRVTRTQHRRRSRA